MCVGEQGMPELVGDREADTCRAAVRVELDPPAVVRWHQPGVVDVLTGDQLGSETMR
jgi:hypothetical protein